MLRHKFRLVCLVLLATITPLAIAQTRLPGEWAKNAVLDKVEAEREWGKLPARDLVTRYKEAIAKTPKHPEAYVKAAAVYPRVESEGLYQKAIAIAPHYLPAHLGLARYYADRDLSIADGLKKSLAEYQKAVALAPKDVALRNEAAAIVARAATLLDLQKLLGNTIAARIAYCNALIINRKHEEAAKQIAALPPSPAHEVKILLLKVRLGMLQSDLEKDSAKRQAIWNEAVEKMFAAWQKFPKEREFYPVYLRGRSLPDVLNGQKRYAEARQVLEKALTIFPDDLHLRQMFWKSLLNEIRPSYAAEKKLISEQAAALLKNNPPAPALYETAIAGFKMADDLSALEETKIQLYAAYPYSYSTRSIRFGEKAKSGDHKERLSNWASVNRDFPSFYPLQLQEYMTELNKLGGSNEEIRQAAEAAVNDVRERGYGNMFLVLRDVAAIFFTRNIYLKDLQTWVEQAQPNYLEILKRDSISGQEGMILTVRARLMIASKNYVEAEQILRRLLAVNGKKRDVYTSEYSYYLAEILTPQGKKEEAMEHYGSAAANGSYLPLAEPKFKALYKELKGSEEGADEKLANLRGITTIAREIKMNIPAPAFDFVQIGGANVRVADLRGKVVIINYWATWCGPCLKEMPHFQKFYEAKKNDPSVAILAVSIDEERAMVEPFIKARKFSFPVYFDDGRHQALNIPPIPAMLIIDPSGHIRVKNTGFAEGDDIEAKLNTLVEQYREKTQKP